jgi:hypothetical protein
VEFIKKDQIIVIWCFFSFVTAVQHHYLYMVKGRQLIDKSDLIYSGEEETTEKGLECLFENHHKIYINDLRVQELFWSPGLICHPSVPTNSLLALSSFLDLNNECYVHPAQEWRKLRG